MLIQTNLRKHLIQLCEVIKARPTGSISNQEATTYLETILLQEGLSVTKQALSSIDWHNYSASLTINNLNCPIVTSNYSTPCNISAPYVCIDNLKALKASLLTNKILVMHGNLYKESLMPKNFPWYNPEEHKEIIRILEEKNPLAIITVSFHDTLPIPIIEDGDFNIPCAVTSMSELPFLLRHQAEILTLKLNTKRTQTTSYNIIAHYGHGPKKISFSAHIDTKPNTPGALDNGTGVATLLTIATQLKNIPSPYEIELVFFNGEDSYNCVGESTYVSTYLNSNDYIFAVNIDGVGLKNSKNTYSFYECSNEFISSIQNIANSFSDLEEIEPWPQGDHMLYAMNGIPTLSMTSSNIFDILDDVIHTEKDTFDLIDFITLENVVNFCLKLISF